MRILQTLVSTDGYRDWRGTADRMTILSTLLGEAARRGCGLVVLPAGFLQARRPDDVELLQNAVVNLVKKTPGVGVVLGIDAGRVTKATLHHRVLRRQPLPYSGLAIEPGGNKVHRWQQQSFLSSHGTAANAISIPARTIDFHGKKVLVLLCGEMFNHAMQAALCGQGLDLIVEAGHDGLGTGLIPTLRVLARNAGCPALYSQHVRSTSRGLHMVLPGPVQASVQASNHVLISGPGLPWVSAVDRVI
jgi:hypothetical protein